MEASYTAVVQQREAWWIGWIEEVPGVNSQGETREELLESLRSALEEGPGDESGRCPGRGSGRTVRGGPRRTGRVKRRALLAHLNARVWAS